MFSQIVIKKVIVLIAFCYAISMVSIYTFYSGWMSLNPLCSAITGTIPILLSVAYFYVLLAKAEVKRLYSYHLFWINSAVLIYFGLAFLVNVYSYILAWNGSLSLMLWPVLMVSNILFNSILSIGVWKMKPT
ncbi:MAG: hypothetical protein ACFHU9_09185 [Fluviicola sp.]